MVGWLWTKHHILLGPRRYFTIDPPLVELSLCSKDGQGEGEAADIAHQPISQGIEPGTTESVDREQSPEPPAPPFRKESPLHTRGVQKVRGPTKKENDFYDETRCEACDVSKKNPDAVTSQSVLLLVSGCWLL